MKVRGDTERVNLSTGERWYRVSGDGESVFVKSRGPIDEARLSPQKDHPFSGPMPEEVVLAARRILEKRKATMHYRNGREAKNGDKIISLAGYGAGGKANAIGVLYDAKPGNDHCNGNIAPIQAPGTTACLCDCLHIDDLEAILAEKGLDKRSAGK
jgi:hypothetical protein